MSRKLITNTFVSLYVVMQATGGPDEDPSDGFELGGWTVGQIAGRKQTDGPVYGSGNEERGSTGPQHLPRGRSTLRVSVTNPDPG
jgi:hypothetical protein